MRIILCFAVAAALTLVTGGCGGQGASAKPQVAYVTNGIASFWVIAAKGARAAARDFDAEVDVQMPAEGVGDQKRIVQSLLARGIDGIAISPIDPDNQTDLLDEAAARVPLITHDSDAPNSRRLCFVGIDNYAAGRACGQLVKQALPQGGRVMLFVGRLEQLNARLRRQGLIDELLDRAPNPTRQDPNAGPIQGERYTVLDTRTDQFDFAKAKAQVEDAIAKYPDLDCVVGLFAYNPPKCLEAVKEAGKTGRIRIVGFDEDDDTLQGIKSGEVYGTVVQDPYRYGYESVRILAALARNDRTVLPAGGFLHIPARQITAANLDSFWTELRRLTQ
ncbi:MAG: sugar-binding protein [Candidatus Latescibacterota bacterium]|jgi:ribose transport system substrate-binding protein